MVHACTYIRDRASRGNGMSESCRGGRFRVGFSLGLGLLREGLFSRMSLFHTGLYLLLNLLVMRLGDCRIAYHGRETRGISITHDARGETGRAYSMTAQSRTVSPPDTPLRLGSVISSLTLPACVDPLSVGLARVGSRTGFSTVPYRTGAMSANRIDWTLLAGDGVKMTRSGNQNMYLTPNQLSCSSRCHKEGSLHDPPEPSFVRSPYPSDHVSPAPWHDHIHRHDITLNRFIPLLLFLRFDLIICVGHRDGFRRSVRC